MNALSPRTPSGLKLSPALMLLLIMLLAAFLRVFLLGFKSFGADEGIAWWMALGEIEHDAPAVYQWAFGWAIHLFGWTEFAGRFPSALFGLLSIPVIYAIGKTCFDSRFGLYAAFFTAISAYLVPLSQEMRTASLLDLEILLLLWILLHILKTSRPHPGWWMALLAIGLAGQYTHCFFIFVLGYLGLALLVVKRPRKWQDAPKYIAIIIAVILLSLPELLKTFSVAADRPHIYAADIYHLKMNSWRLLRSFFCFLFGDYFTNRPGSILPFLKAHPAHLGIALLMMATWIVIALRSLREVLKVDREKKFSARAVRILLGMLGAFTLLFLVVDISTSGHLIFIYIPFLLLITTYWAYSRDRAKAILLALFLTLTGVSLAHHYKMPTFPHQRADWRSAGRILADEMRPREALLILQARNAYYTLKFYYPELAGDIYYYPRHDPEAIKNQTLMDWWDRKSSEEKLDDLLETHNRVWMVNTNPRRAPRLEGAEYNLRSWDLGYDLELYRAEKNVSVSANGWGVSRLRR